MLRLTLTPDASEGAGDPLTRAWVEFELMGHLCTLPAGAGDVEIDQRVGECLVTWKEATARKPAAPIGEVMQKQMALVAASLLKKSVGLNGRAYAGVRWRLVPREAVNKAAVLQEALQANTNLQQTLGRTT